MRSERIYSFFIHNDMHKNNNLLPQSQKALVLVFYRGWQTHLGMTGRKEGRCKAIKYEQQAKRQCNPPLHFTSVIHLHKLSKKYRDKARICKRQRGQRGISCISLKPNPLQVHKLHLFSPLIHSKGNPKLLEVARREQAWAPLPVLQLHRQVASWRPELLDQVLPDPPGSSGRAQGPW